MEPWQLALLAVGLSALALHPLGYLLETPFWVDEAWVAIATKASFLELRDITGPTPVGFTFLVWLIPWPGPQAQRLLPLAFTVGSIIAAGVFVRHLAWKGRWCTGASLVTAAAVALAPTSLMRNDLKQFTVDAFVALVILALTAWIESEWSQRGLSVLAAVSLLGALLSTTSLVVSFAAFGGLTLVPLAGRDYARFRSALYRGVSAGIGITLVLVLFMMPQLQNQALRAYWQRDYLDGSIAEIASAVWAGTAETLAPNSGWGFLLLPLFCIGLVWMFWTDRSATGVALVLIWIALLLLGVMDRYPFLDARTSHFVVAITTAVAAVGLIVAIRGIWSRSRLAALLLTAFCAGVFFANVAPHLGSGTIPHEDIRSQVDHLVSHRTSSDVILVNFHGAYGFSYYWPSPKVTFLDSETVATGFLSRVAERLVIYTNGRSSAAIGSALDQSLELAKSKGSGRVWIARSHVNQSEMQHWQSAFQDRDIEPEVILVGPEPLLLIRVDPGPASGDWP